MSLIVFYWDLKAFDPIASYTIQKDRDTALSWLSKKQQLWGGVALHYEMTNSVDQVISLGDKWVQTFPEMYAVCKQVLQVCAAQKWKDIIPDNAYEAFDSSVLWADN